MIEVIAPWIAAISSWVVLALLLDLEKKRKRLNDWINDNLDATGFHQELVKAEQSGHEDERNRIIKLLIDEGVFCNGHWHHECLENENCILKINGGWHGVSPCEWDFMGGNECKRVIALIRVGKNENN